MSDKLATVEAQPLARADEPDTFLSFLERASKDPSFDVAKFEALMAAKERADKRESERLFAVDMTGLQAAIHPLVKSGTNEYTKSKYTRLDDMLVELRPLLDQFGFAIGFDCAPIMGANGAPTNMLDFSCTFTHRAGHAETKHLPLPIDGTGSKGGKSNMNEIQSVGSTTTYARRYLIDMHLNIARRGQDDDGNGGPRYISAELATKLRNDLEVVGGNPEKFLALMHAKSFEEIREPDYAKACQFIEAKRRQKEGAK